MPARSELSTIDTFFSPFYSHHSMARLQHLASLGLPLEAKRVLELGSGPGGHTGFYRERGCHVVSVDARQECLDGVIERFPDAETRLCDLNTPLPLLDLGTFEIVHCYGILYHLQDPAALLSALPTLCSGFTVIETCVSFGDESEVPLVGERYDDFTASVTGLGCRPTRLWVFEALQRLFPFVYLTRTQPYHAEFPIDWTVLRPSDAVRRSVFVASKQPFELASLSTELLDHQTRFNPNA